MRDRLIELITESDILCHTCGENSSSYCAEAIADLIITDGWIRPPCKVGDKVYWFKLNDEFVEAEIERCYFSAKTENGKEYYVPFTSLGKTVFLTREEAEAKQKEGEGGMVENTCNTCKANKVCDHNQYGFENCNNYISSDVVEIETVRKWLIKQANFNEGVVLDGNFSSSCKRLASIIDELRKFAQKRSDT